MNEVEFSFIMPVYNTSAQYLKESIQSITRIKKCSYEVIIVDDGSKSDDTLSVLNLYEKAPDIKVIHKQNGGVSSARNTGLDNAVGNYIMFVDSDDYIDTEVFENVCLRVVSEYPDKDIFIFANHDVNGSGEFIQKSPQKEDIVICDHILHTYSAGAPIGVTWVRESVWGKIFKREIIGQNRFASGMKYGEDNLFVLNISLAVEEIVCCAAPVYCYRRNDASVTNCYTPTILEDRMKNIIEIEQMYKKYHLDDALIDLCYDIIFRTYLHLVLRQWVFHKNNHISFLKKSELARNILSNEYFSKKLQGIDLSRLRKKDRYIIWLLRKKFVYLGYKLFALRKPKLLRRKV